MKWKIILRWSWRLLFAIVFMGILLSFSSGDIGASSISWFEFTLPWDDSSASFLSFDNGGPVTQPIRVGSDGHFHLGSASGPRVRLFGINFAGGKAFLPHDQADKTAKRLAKLGFNLARMSGLEGALLSSTDPIIFNETALDKLFYFIARLKENGIYVGLMLNIGPDAQRPTVYFDPDTIALQKDYLRKLLTEEANPYTGLTLAQDPALALVQFINEIYMLVAFMRCDLHTEEECGEVSGLSVRALSETAPWLEEWQLVPENVNQTESDYLDAQWNARLLAHYVSRAALETAWEQGCSGKISLNPGEDPAAGTVERIFYADWEDYCPNRLIDTVTFYYQLAQEHIANMFSYLKNTLGLGDIPITTVENFAGMPTKFTQHGTNTMAQHVPWARTYRFNGILHYVNAPMVKGPYTGPFKSGWPYWVEFRNTIWKAATTSVLKDKPFILTEYNHPSPNEFQAEFPLLISAYGNFQDWDGISLHEYGTPGGGMIECGWDLDDNPAVMAQIPAAARVFRNGWVEAGSDVNELVVPFWEEGDFNGASGVLNDWWKCLGKHYCYWEDTSIPNPKGISPAWSLVRKVRMEFRDSPAAVPNPGTPPTSPYISDTGELTWDMDDGLVTVDAPRVQAAIGFVNTQQVNLSSLKVDATGAGDTDFAAISLVPLDGSTIASSQKLLLTAASRVKNTGMDPAPPQPQEELTLNSWGGPPVLLQRVVATVTLTLPQAAVIRVYRLDETGNLDAQVAYQVGSEITFDIGTHDTLWYGVVVEPTDTAAVFRVTKEGDVFADKAFSSQAADIAERINVSEPVEPGDVVELDPQRPGYYRKVREPYSTTVVGVISSRPGVSMGERSGYTRSSAILSSGYTSLAFEGLNLSSFDAGSHSISRFNHPAIVSLSSSPFLDRSPPSLASASRSLSNSVTFALSISDLERLGESLITPATTDSRSLLALMGVVPVKATVENGPIQPGDLLVPSSIPGYVMRCADLHRCEGATVGKALEPLEEGRSMIKMLVMR